MRRRGEEAMCQNRAADIFFLFLFFFLFLSFPRSRYKHATLYACPSLWVRRAFDYRFLCATPRLESVKNREGTLRKRKTLKRRIQSFVLYKRNFVWLAREEDRWTILSFLWELGLLYSDGTALCYFNAATIPPGRSKIRIEVYCVLLFPIKNYNIMKYYTVKYFLYESLFIRISLIMSE